MCFVVWSINNENKVGLIATWINVLCSVASRDCTRQSGLKLY